MASFTVISKLNPAEPLYGKVQNFFTENEKQNIAFRISHGDTLAEETLANSPDPTQKIQSLYDITMKQLLASKEGMTKPNNKGLMNKVYQGPIEGAMKEKTRLASFYNENRKEIEALAHTRRFHPEKYTQETERELKKADRSATEIIDFFTRPNATQQSAQICSSCIQDDTHLDEESEPLPDAEEQKMVEEGTKPSASYNPHPLLKTGHNRKVAKHLEQTGTQAYWIIGENL